jgi:integrase
MALYHDSLAEYSWARDVAGLAGSTLQKIIQPVIEVCEFYDCVPWQLTPRRLDEYFTGAGRRAVSTTRKKLLCIDGYFAFLEQRYAGEIHRRFGAVVCSPVDTFNRPRHRGDFGLRVPPSRRAMLEFFAAWRAALPAARKYHVAARDYVMAKIAYLSGVRAAELCAVRIGDVHWELGQWGRFVVQGKGAHGSGPRERMAFLFAEGRELLWWYMEEIRGDFCDDPDDLLAPLWPSERLPTALAAVDYPSAPALGPDAFRRALRAAGAAHLRGPVRRLFPHLLRHACATHNYEAGMPLWDVQKLLGHVWPSTTVGYLATVQADPELASLASSQRAVRRLTEQG